MIIPGIFSKSAKRYFLGLIFLFSQLYAYSQACNCPPINTCGTCSGDYSEFTFRYNGFPAIRVDATDQTGTLYTNIWVPTGTILTFDGNPGNGKFMGQVKLWVNGFEHVTFESNCSFGLIVGNDYGSFTLLAAKSKLGGPLCCQSAALDTTDPIISGCPGNISVFANATCSTPVSWTAPTATDNCGAVTLSSTHAPGSNFPKGVTPVQYTATDDFGNTSTCSFNVTVVDNTNPVISGCPSNIVVNANASCQATVNWTAPTASDNCGTVTLTTTKNPGTVFSLGTTTVIYTATDAAGRTSTCSFNVVVQDNTNPVISGCPSNIVVNANASCQATVNWTAPTVSDNCGAALTSTKNPGTIFSLGTTLVTYTATDAAGNTATCSFNVTVQDNTNPVITGCPSNITVNANASCQATVNWTAPTVSDNCGGTLTLTTTKNPGTIFTLGTTIVTYTATDATGNTSTCSFNVIVQDNTNPVITGCPSNITVNADASCQATVNWIAPTVSDNCGGTLTLTTTKNPGTLFNIGTTPVTYTATDAAGNTSTCSFNVIVQDNTNPVIAGCPSNITVNANGSCQATVNWIAPTVSDNCGGTLTLTSTRNPGTIFNLGTTPVTYTATDAAGNTSTCSFNVIVQDNINPVIAGCPSNITVNANGSCQATVNWTAPTVSDNCGGTLTLTTTKNPGTLFNIGTTPVTYTATDAAGNTATCSFNVTVQDNTNPVITGCPSNITVNANASCQATVNWIAPTVSDNCGGTLTLTTTKNPGTLFNIGTTPVTYTATDAAGNTSTCSFNVIVQDNTNPVIAGCPSNITVNADASCQATVNWIAPTVSDNCGGTLTLTTTKNPGTLFNIGTTPVTYTATDAAGNTSTCSFNVIVQDNTNPVIAGCPSNITVNANASCQATVNWTAPTASDNCGTVTLTTTKNPGTVFSLGTTTVIYTATDAAGRTSTCSFNVVVQDNTNPVIAGCPSNITVNANALCQATVNWIAPTVSDNCAGALTLTATKNPGTIFNLGTTLVTYTATDAAGNTSTCSFNVIVQDNTNPVIAGCPSNITVNANASCQATVNWIAPTVSDNCGGTLTLTTTKNPGTIFTLGTTIVTYTATDAAGNTSTCSFNVIVQDNTNPVIAGCPSNITVNANASCQATVNWIAPTVSDNCGGTLTLTTTKNPGTIFNLGTTPVTYTATDAAGNTSTCSFNVIVQDNTNPVIAGCPSNIVVNANASCQATVNWTAPTASDNCGTVTLTTTKNPGTVFSLGTTTVIYTATDAAGRTSTCSFNVVVQDNTNPVIAGCPSNITVNANGSCQATVNWIAPTVSDNCGGTLTLTTTKNPGTLFNIGTTPVTYTATDAAGNTATCSFNVTVQDNTNPVITGCPSNITVNANASCQATVNWIAPTMSDNCGGTLTLTTTKNPGTIFNLGTTIVTYTATDAAGNSSTCSFNVIVQDNTNPVIAGCPSNITVNANASCQATVNWIAPTVSDNCGGTLTLTTTKNPGTLFNIGTTPVTYTATDAAGNTSTCSFNVIVQDNTNPVIAGCPSNITVNANASCQATVNWTAPTASDNCGTVTLTTTKNPGTVFSLGTTTVIYTATDAAGRTSTCSFNVVVQDNTNPVIAGCPSNITVNANALCQATVNWIAPTVSDNCAGALTLTSTKNPGTIFNLGTTNVTYTATDAAGNTSTCSFNVTVQDNTNPVITGCPSNITVNANASCQATVNWTAPTVSDNCGGTLTLTTTKNPGTIFTLGTTIVTYTATDATGNTSTCSFNVIVQDNTNPVIAGCPSNITVNANASCQATVNWIAPTVSDNCGGTLTLTTTKNPGTIFNIGTTPVTYTATDAAGNTSTCSFNVIVLDNTNPVIAGCPSNITVNAIASCQATVSWIAPTVSDNCAGTLTLTTTKSPGTVFNLGTTVVTYTATDAAGNTSTCSFNVTVQDNTNPVITGCPSNITVNANASCQATVNWTAPTVSDNCGGTLNLTTTKNPGTLFNIGTTPVTYTATDAAGNTSTCSFNVIVQDNTNPVIAGCPSNITVNANASCQATVNWIAPTVSDNCGGTLTLTTTKNPGTLFNIGTTPVTYTATDAAGNTSTCSFNVIVQDNTNPVIAGCPSNITVNANASCQATVNWIAPTVSDNCAGTLTLTTTKSPGTVFGLGTTVVTYTATDAAGNTSTCSFGVTVQGNTNPVIAGCPSNITVNANASCQATVNWAPPTASGNCGGTITMTSTKNPGTLFSLGTTPVTYTATDAAGNTSTCSFNVTVLDNTGPTITGCPANITVSANASCQATVSWTVPTATDNCSGAISSTSTKSPGSVFSLGSTLVTYTATDAAGNTSTCSFTVVVQDDVPPQFSACSDIKVSSGVSCQANVTWVAPVASDCGPITVTSSHKSGDLFPVGTTQVTYTAIDSDGHSSTCSFNVIVEDKTPPLLASCPSNIIVKTKNACEASVSWTEPTAIDNCLGVTLTKSHSPGAVFPGGTTVVEYTATDTFGNKTICQFNVTVKVESLPVIGNCPANIQAESNEYGEAVVEWAVPTVTAACGAITLTSSHQPGDTFPIGTTTVEYKAEDPFANVAYCRFQVEVMQREIELDISQIVTPDGNTQNDEWIVENIEKFANNKVVIVDRWGSVIYTASGYNNETVVWKGHNRNGDLVPSGTYFYTISVRHGSSVFEKTGFIELVH